MDTLSNRPEKTTKAKAPEQELREKELDTKEILGKYLPGIVDIYNNTLRNDLNSSNPGESLGTRDVKRVETYIEDLNELATVLEKFGENPQTYACVFSQRNDLEGSVRLRVVKRGTPLGDNPDDSQFQLSLYLQDKSLVDKTDDDTRAISLKGLTPEQVAEKRRDTSRSISVGGVEVYSSGKVLRTNYLPGVKLIFETDGTLSV